MSRISGSIRTERYYQILTLVYVSPLSQAKIAKILKKAAGIGSRSYVSELLEDMEKEGLINRKQRGNTKVVHITEKGISFVQKNSFVSSNLVRTFVERILSNMKVEYYRSVHARGIVFDFAVPSKSSYIKIIDGIITHWNENILKVLPNAISRENLILDAHIELIDIVERLVREKGLLLSTINYAFIQSDKRVLLIVTGEHPENWSEHMIRLLNVLGERLKRPLIIDAKEVLIHVLSKLPENIDIIFTGNITIDELMRKIMSLVQ